MWAISRKIVTLDRDFPRRIQSQFQRDQHRERVYLTRPISPESHVGPSTGVIIAVSSSRSNKVEAFTAPGIFYCGISPPCWGTKPISGAPTQRSRIGTPRYRLTIFYRISNLRFAEIRPSFSSTPVTQVHLSDATGGYREICSSAHCGFLHPDGVQPLLCRQAPRAAREKYRLREVY